MTLQSVRAEIVQACQEAARAPESVTLVAVSKSQPLSAIEAALQEGQRVFGENKVQEAETKFPALRKKYPDIELHCIGHLQTNKVKMAVGIFDVIETVDRANLAEALAIEMKRQHRFLPCFVQVNTGEEPQKGGITPQDLSALLHVCRDAGLRIEGLMCIPPVDEDARKHFLLLAQLAKEAGLAKLSMGMSADFPTAIRCGATHVRVGSAVFGERVDP